jgi:hypothetical protein
MLFVKGDLEVLIFIIGIIMKRISRVMIIVEELMK